MLGDKHGLSKHPLHNVWHGIKCRCYGKTSKPYKKYGALGVIMCEEWKNNFKSFYDWAIANGWEKGLQIDKDIKSKELGVEANLYSPERCSVVTAKVNSNNKSSNRVITFNGQTKTLSEWADITGIHRNTIRVRLEYHGFSIKDALTSPIGKVINDKKCKLISYNGQTKSLSEWGKELNAKPSHINRSLKSGKAFEYIYNRYKSGKKRADAKN
jgi:hypothetical protein